MLSKSSDEFQRIVQYVKNTHAATHNHYDLEVEEVFKLDRQGERDRFSSLNNRQLLWHGSGVTNFCGILSQVGVCSLGWVGGCMCVSVCV